MSIDEIIENFSLLDDWDDRYRYVIELGRSLAPLPEPERSEANKVQGCASQVWLASEVERDGAAGPLLNLTGDSDAHIVRGLIAILFALYSGKGAQQILERPNVDDLGWVVLVEVRFEVEHRVTEVVHRPLHNLLR